MTRQELAMLLQGVLTKTAETPADQLGVAPGGAAGAPPGGDPAAAGAAPMDPAMMAPPGPPPDLDTLAAQGDPLAKELLDHRNLLTQILTALKLIMDQAQLKAPASQLLQTMPATPPKKTASAPNKVSDAPPPQPPVAAEVEETPEVAIEHMPAGEQLKESELQPPIKLADLAPPPTWSMGQAGQPGAGGAYAIKTQMSPKPVGVGRQIAEFLQRGSR